MRSISLVSLLVATLIGLAAATSAQAQAPRTWISGVGDDVNPCSRTAPCKTFAGAISKTAVGGEIDALDPAGYGAVTITKSITLDGGTGSGWASILYSGTNGIIINAAASDVVTLRNITFNGIGAGLNGIRIIQAGKVYIENVVIFGNNAAAPNGRGISDERTGGGQLFVTNVVIRNNSQTGIVVAPASGSTTIEATVRGTQVKANGNAGIAATQGAHVNIVDSLISGNTTYGVYLDQAAGSTQVTINNTSIVDNSTGILLGPGNPTLVLSGVSVMDNDTGMVRGTGPVYTFNNNAFVGNAAGSGPFAPAFTSVTPL